MLPGHVGGKGGWVGFFDPPAGVRSKGEQEAVANKEYLVFFFPPQDSLHTCSDADEKENWKSS